MDDMQARVRLAFARDYRAIPGPELFEEGNAEGLPKAISRLIVELIAAERGEDYDRGRELQSWGEFTERQRISEWRDQRLRTPRGQSPDVSRIEIANIFRL